MIKNKEDVSGIIKAMWELGYKDPLATIMAYDYETDMLSKLEKFLIDLVINTDLGATIATKYVSFKIRLRCRSAYKHIPFLTHTGMIKEGWILNKDSTVDFDLLKEITFSDKA